MGLKYLKYQKKNPATRNITRLQLCIKLENTQLRNKIYSYNIIQHHTTPKNLIYMQGVVGFSKSMFPKSTKINSTVFQTSNTIIPVNHPINDIHQGSQPKSKKSHIYARRCW